MGRSDTRTYEDGRQPVNGRSGKRFIFRAERVWAVGFLLGILSLAFGDRVVTVPGGTLAAFHADVTNAEVRNDDGSTTRKEFKDREVLVLPEKAHLPRAKDEDPSKAPDHPWLH